MSTGRVRSAKYRRISDDREGDELGVTRQDVDLDTYNATRGYDVVADYLDNDIGASTRTKKTRVDYQRMLTDARAHRFEVVTAYTSSRITRRPREHEDLIELAEAHGIRFEFIRSPSFDLNTADGRMIARMLAAADAAESERIAERVSRAIRANAEAGNPRGPAFGYGPDGVKHDPQEARLLEAAYEGVLMGRGLHGIAAMWNAAGTVTRHGNPWRPKTVRDVLRNPRNAGLVAYCGTVLPDVDAKWQPIVSEDVWRGVIAVLGDPARLTSPTNLHRYLLAGIARCGVCQGPTITGATRRGTRSVKCAGRRHLERAAPPIEEHVVATLLQVLGRDSASAGFQMEGPDLAPLRLEAAALTARRKALVAYLEEDELMWGRRDRALKARLDEIERVLAARMRVGLLNRFVGRVPREVWRDLDLHERRAVLAEAVDVVVLPVGQGFRGSVVDTVRITRREPAGH